MLYEFRFANCPQTKAGNALLNNLPMDYNLTMTLSFLSNDANREEYGEQGWRQREVFHAEETRPGAGRQRLPWL